MALPAKIVADHNAQLNFEKIEVTLGTAIKNAPIKTVPKTAEGVWKALLELGLITE